MTNIELVGKVVAYGTPPLLILLGYSAFMGGKMMEPIFGSSDITSMGAVLMVIGIAMGVGELILKFR
jgi:hypothetical protein